MKSKVWFLSRVLKNGFIIICDVFVNDFRWFYYVHCWNYLYRFSTSTLGILERTRHCSCWTKDRLCGSKMDFSVFSNDAFIFHQNESANSAIIIQSFWRMFTMKKLFKQTMSIIQSEKKRTVSETNRKQ